MLHLHYIILLLLWVVYNIVFSDFRMYYILRLFSVLFCSVYIKVYCTYIPSLLYIIFDEWRKKRKWRKIIIQFSHFIWLGIFSLYVFHVYIFETNTQDDLAYTVGSTCSFSFQIHITYLQIYVYLMNGGNRGAQHTNWKLSERKGGRRHIWRAVFL